MKVKIWTDSQSEFNEKRSELVKALSKGEIKLPIYRKPVYQAQRELLEHWDKEFKTMLEEIKKEIDGILEEK